MKMMSLYNSMAEKKNNNNKKINKKMGVFFFSFSRGNVFLSVFANVKMKRLELTN